MLSDCIKNIEKNLSYEEIYEITKLLRGAYQPFFVDTLLWYHFETTLPSKVYSLIEPYKKTVLGRDIVNALIVKYYPGECNIKYHLSKKYLNKLDEVSTFELNIGSSRLDFGRINGKSIAYEIKTEVDSLNKLEKQINDYSKVFDYLFVVIHKKHLEKAKEIIPEYCGIISFRRAEEQVIFHHNKKSLPNPNIVPFEQLKNLTKKELEKILKRNSLEIPENKEDREELILSKLMDHEINTAYKLAIKRKYFKKWAFLKENYERINPIDFQVFFKTELDPYEFYYKNSSMV